jgi:hypothetical protein
VIKFIMISSFVLTGCSAAHVRGRPAETVQECRADFVTETKAARGGVLVGGTLGQAITSTVISAGATTAAKRGARTRYVNCLAKLGQTPETAEALIQANASTPVPHQRATTRSPASKRSVTGNSANGKNCSLELVGGTGYACVGRR